MANDTFKRGSMEMLTLLILQTKDAHGYELAQLIEERSGGILTIQEGALYPLLYRMAECGYISGHDVIVNTPHGRKRTRVVYHIEPLGKKRFAELKEGYDQVLKGIRDIFAKCEEIGYVEREFAPESGCEEISPADRERDSLLPKATRRRAKTT